MKKSILFLIIALLVSFTVTYAQGPVVAARQVQKMDNAKVGGTNPMEASAVLEVESTTKGFLLPRMTTQQRTDITSPAAGLQVYDTELKDIWLYNGTAWVKAGGAKFVDGTIPADAVFTGGSVGIGGQPNASAVLDINSTTKGMLLPRMTTAERDLIAAPIPNGLMIYNTINNAIEQYSLQNLRWGSYSVNSLNLNATVSTPGISMTKENTTATPLAAGTLGRIDFRGWDNVRGNNFPAFRMDVTNLASEPNGNIPTSIGFTHHQVGGSGGNTRNTALFLSANRGIGVNTNTPHASAQLDVTSTNKGFLPPRMTSDQMGNIILPSEGLIVYCTNCQGGKGLRLFDGVNWVNMAGATATAAAFTFTGVTSQAGDFFAGKVFDATSKAVVQINVTTAGVITFTSTIVNGYQFQQYIELSNTGIQNVELNAIGTQTAFNAAGDAFTITGVGTTTQTQAITIVHAQSGAMFASFSNGTENFSQNTDCVTKAISTSTTCPASITVGSNTYNAVNINGQCWMTTNLKEIPSNFPDAPNTGTNVWLNTTQTDKGYWGYYNTTTTSGSSGWGTTEPAAGEGLLYQRSAAMNGSNTERAQGVCPTGWHIPSDCEFMYLEHGLGMSTTIQKGNNTIRTDGSVGTKLSLLTGSGTNSSGFTGLLTGTRNASGTFSLRASRGHFWLSSNFQGSPFVRFINAGNVGISRNTNIPGSSALNVRCLKDN